MDICLNVRFARSIVHTTSDIADITEESAK